MEGGKMSSDKVYKENRIRHFDQDTPFGDWLRKQKDLPSNSDDFGFVATDVDMVVQNWKRNDTGQSIKNMMQIEVKTRNGGSTGVPHAQMETLSILSSFAGEKRCNNLLFRFYGVFFLTLSNTSPENSEDIWWCGWKYHEDDEQKIVRLTKSNLIWHKITEETLISLLRFDINPITLEPMSFFHDSDELEEL